jgi:NACalpha-BTF3-like transcription factor
MGNSQSKLTNFINENNNINNPLLKKVILLINEYETTLEKYSSDISNPVITRTINKFKPVLENEVEKLIEYINEHPISSISDNKKVQELEPDTEKKLKTFGNLLIEQLSKIQKQELINEGVAIMQKQTVINREQAIQFLVKNNYNPVSALLAFMNHKETPEAQTYFTFQLNQHELINELVRLSADLTATTHTTESLSQLTKTKNQSYVCILINDDKDLRKIKKYSSIQELYEIYVSQDITQMNIHSFKINGEEFALLVNPTFITSEPKETYINKPTTLALRNMDLIGQTDFYTGPALFINNFFLH